MNLEIAAEKRLYCMKLWQVSVCGTPSKGRHICHSPFLLQCDLMLWLMAIVPWTITFFLYLNCTILGKPGYFGVPLPTVLKRMQMKQHLLLFLLAPQAPSVSLEAVSIAGDIHCLCLFRLLIQTEHSDPFSEEDWEAHPEKEIIEVLPPN